ncbi:MAG: HAMP domain-containing sensor histidine kinase [Pseudomonadota bacterium]
MRPSNTISLGILVVANSDGKEPASLLRLLPSLLEDDLRREGLDPYWQLVGTSEEMVSALDEREWDVVLAKHDGRALDTRTAIHLIRQHGLAVPLIVINDNGNDNDNEPTVLAAIAEGAADCVPAGCLVRLGVLLRREAERAALRRENTRLSCETEETLRARDSFISVASHELKTPLTPLQLHLDSLLQIARKELSGKLAERISSRLEAARRQVGRLDRLMDILLSISRIAGNRFELSAESFDLAALAWSVARRLLPSLRRTGSELVFQADAPVVGLWDREWIEDMIENLLTNAGKFGAGKPIELSVVQVDRTARLCVRDHGIGVRVVDQPRVFECFERAASECHYAGLGLGLWITRQIVEAHGGTIRISSRPGEGAKLVVEIPLAETKQAR